MLDRENRMQETAPIKDGIKGIVISSLYMVPEKVESPGSH
jgi:hypothetical protein